MDSQKVADNSKLPEKLLEMHWGEGVRLLPKVIPDKLIEEHFTERADLLPGSQWKDGWPSLRCFIEVPSLVNNATSGWLMNALVEFLGTEGELLSCESSFLPNTEPWGQELCGSYPERPSNSVSALVCLEDADPVKAPFQYVPHSHRFTEEEQSEALECLDSSDETVFRKYQPTRLVFGKGDALIFHPFLLYRLSDLIGCEERRILLFRYHGGSKCF